MYRVSIGHPLSQEADMAEALAKADGIDVRDRLLSAAEAACAAWIVIGHNVFRIFPNEAPILAAIALVSVRFHRGGWRALGFRRPSSWRTVVLLAIRFVVVRSTIGFAI